MFLPCANKEVKKLRDTKTLRVFPLLSETLEREVQHPVHHPPLRKSSQCYSDRLGAEAQKHTELVVKKSCVSDPNFPFLAMDIK